MIRGDLIFNFGWIVFEKSRFSVKFLVGFGNVEGMLIESFLIILNNLWFDVLNGLMFVYIKNIFW